MSMCACAFKFHHDAVWRKVRECVSALCHRFSGGGYVGKYWAMGKAGLSNFGSFVLKWSIMGLANQVHAEIY